MAPVYSGREIILLSSLTHPEVPSFSVSYGAETFNLTVSLEQTY